MDDSSKAGIVSPRGNLLLTRFDRRNNGPAWGPKQANAFRPLGEVQAELAVECPV